MGTNYKAALIPQRIRDTIHGWGKEARRRRRRLGIYGDDSTVHTDTSTVISVEEFDDHHELDSPRARMTPGEGLEIELQQHSVVINSDSDSPFVANENSSRVGTPLLRSCASVSSATSPNIMPEIVTRSSSLPAQRE